MDSSFAAQQTALAHQVANSLADCGVRLVVISPGSRSTPLVLAVSEHPMLECRPIADERSAAFFALGSARMSGVPAALICTSGTAAGHYLPAVMEAAAAHLPLLVITANRPPERDDCGAPQTADQRRLFGEHARGYYELPLAEADPRSRRAAARSVAQAVLRSQWPEPGPVQVDVRLRKPLEPVPEDDGVGCVSTPRITAPPMVAAAAGLDVLTERFAAAERPVVVFGPEHPNGFERPKVEELLDAGLPVAAELTSQLYSGGVTRGLSVLLESRTARSMLDADLIVQVGEGLVSGGWEPWLEERVASGAEHWVLTKRRISDPVSTASEVVIGSTTASLEHLAKVRREDSSPWRERLGAMDGIATSCVREFLDAEDELTEARVASEVVRSLAEGGLLGLGNSLAIRLAETYAHDVPGDARIVHQRGLAGIDGLISGFAGSLAVSSGVSAARLLFGDVSCVHDLTGLGLLSGRCDALVIVIDNGGGRIFDRLPIAQVALSVEQRALYTTEPTLSFESAARAFGLDYREASTLEELVGALEEAGEPRTTARLVRAVCPPGREARQHRRLIQSLDEALQSQEQRSWTGHRGNR